MSMRIFVVKKRTIIRTAVFVALIVGAIVFTQVALSGTAPVVSMSEAMPICSVATDEMAVALTIDTAFGDEDYTDEILSVLKGGGARATFFVMGLWANEHPDALDGILRGGQEIASHSMNHTRYPDMQPSEMLYDASDAADLIFDKTGYDTRLLRLPYGAFSDESIRALEGEGFVPMKWSLDSKDWKGYDAEKIADAVVGQAQPGDIIMFQNNMEQTPQALSSVILGLREAGYKIVPVGDLLLDGDYIIDSSGTQRYFED